MKLSLSTSLSGFTTSAVPFVGPLDAYATGALALWGISYRLFTSYTDPLFRVRRTGDDEMDIEAKANGLFDVAALTDFVGSDPWWYSQWYDQTGNGNHVTYAASGQPRGAIDGNGLAYAYAETGPFDKQMVKNSLAIAATDTTHWTVGGNPGYAQAGAMIRSTLPEERKVLNYGNRLLAKITNPATGTGPSILGTNTGVYSHVLQVGGAGCRLNCGTGVSTGTKTSVAMTIAQVGVGSNNGGPTWAANAPFYAGGVWTADVGNTNADAIQQVGRDFYFAQ